MAVLCGMLTVQYSARSVRLSVRLSDGPIANVFFKLNDLHISRPTYLYLQLEKASGTPYRLVPLEKSIKM